MEGVVVVESARVNVEYDLINSCFCVCVAAKSLQDYQQGVVKLFKLLKSGGVLMIFESLHKECQLLTYPVKDHQCSYLAVTREFVLKAFGDAGFVNVTVESMELDPNHPSKALRPERVGYFHVMGVKP